MKSNVTTTIETTTWQLAKDKDISWAKALEFGIQFLVAEKEGCGYPPCSLLDRIQAMQKRISREELTAEQEADSILKGEIDNG